jgi:transcriptional regulator with XRE-family HTH domain
VQRRIAFRRLRQLRENAGYTQEEIAKRLKISEKQYSLWERGKANPNYDSLIDLVTFFNVTADYLMGRTEHPQGYPAQQGLSEDERAIIDLYRREGLAGLAGNILQRLTQQIAERGDVAGSSAPKGD